MLVFMGSVLNIAVHRVYCSNLKKGENPMTGKEKRASFRETIRQMHAVQIGEAAQLRTDSKGRLWITTGEADLRIYQTVAHVADADVVQEVRAHEASLQGWERLR